MMRWVLVMSCSAIMAIVAVAASPDQTSPPNPFVGSTGDVQVEVLGTGADVYLLSGGGGNTLAVVDEASGGIVLVDPKPKGWGKRVVDALSGVTDLPVTTIINTHAHEPQIGASDEFPKVAQIIAHENTKARMATLDAFKGANARLLPHKTVTTRYSWPSARAVSTMARIGTAPSLQLVCRWQSPRSASRTAKPPVTPPTKPKK